jgi:hypothetical protein
VARQKAVSKPPQSCRAIRIMPVSLANKSLAEA